MSLGPHARVIPINDNCEIDTRRPRDVTPRARGSDRRSSTPEEPGHGGTGAAVVAADCAASATESRSLDLVDALPLGRIGDAETGARTQFFVARRSLHSSEIARSRADVHGPRAVLRAMEPSRDGDGTSPLLPFLWRSDTVGHVLHSAGAETVCRFGAGTMKDHPLRHIDQGSPRPSAHRVVAAPSELWDLRAPMARRNDPYIPGGDEAPGDGRAVPTRYHPFGARADHAYEHKLARRTTPLVGRSTEGLTP